jgi:hypothetical protein
VHLVEAVTPGIAIMLSSSPFEAFDAGEPITMRWICGFWPRCLRAVIVDESLNQLMGFEECS